MTMLYCTGKMAVSHLLLDNVYAGINYITFIHLFGSAFHNTIAFMHKQHNLICIYSFQTKMNTEMFYWKRQNNKNK